jgi:TPR repeat protein
MKSFALGALLVTAALPALSTPATAGVREGVDAWEAGSYAKAVAEWRGPAASGDPDAQFNLAQAYKLGRGVTADLKLAQDWYRKAAEQGHEQAQANLGLILYQNGNRAGAMPWLQKAAERGEPRAEYVLGAAYFNGELVTRDWPRAYALMTRAAAAGLPQATTSLAQMDRYLSLAQRQQGIALAKQMAAPVAPPAPAPAAPAKPTPTVRPVPVPPSVPAPPPAVARPAPVAPAAAASASRGAGWRIQLGAFASPDAARTAWTALIARTPALKGLQPSYQKAGSLTRLQAGPLASRWSADRACQSAKAAGAGCFPVAP